jgi:hypothetical protein
MKVVEVGHGGSLLCDMSGSVIQLAGSGEQTHGHLTPL